MRVTDTYQPPTSGISTLDPRNRLDGHAGLQTNFQSDPVEKLTRRPSATWITTNFITNLSEDNVVYHRYERDGDEFLMVMDKDESKLHCYKNNILDVTLIDFNGYTTPNGDPMVAKTINHTTFWINPNTIVGFKVHDGVYPEAIAYLNVIAALNYGEKVTIKVITPSGSITETYTVPIIGTSPVDYNAADTARSTSVVAAALATDINGNANIEARSLGSTVAIWLTGADLGEWPEVEVESGQGTKSVVAVNEVNSTPTGLPLFAIEDSLVTIKPSPTSDSGTYYLKAERTGVKALAALTLSEVVWVETKHPTELFELDETTMPYIVEYDGADFTHVSDVFKPRTRGDNTSVPVPEFVGKTITNVNFMQNRLMFLTGKFVVMSETNDVLNFWKQSGVKDLVTDPIAIASTAIDITDLKYAIPHNKSMLILSEEGQLKIDGNTPLIPDTASMSVTTAYTDPLTVEPVVMGNSVYLPIDYGDSTGLRVYSTQEEAIQDFSSSVSHHVKGYMKGEIDQLAANSNLEMIALTTTESADNKIYIFEQASNPDGTVIQRAWYEWDLEGEGVIVSMKFIGNKLSLVVRHSTDSIYFTIKEISLHTKITTLSDIFLDNMLILATDGSGCTIPNIYDITNCIVVQGEGTDNELSLISFTSDGNDITFDEDIGAGTVYLGLPFESRYRPTRPFKRDERGIADTSDRIRIQRYTINVVDTHEIKAHILSDYYSEEDQVFSSRFVGDINNVLGEVPFFSGDVKFPYGQNAAYADIELYTDSHLGLTIASIAWSGQYFRSAGGI